MFIGVLLSLVGGGIWIMIFVLNFFVLFYFVCGNKLVKVFKWELYFVDFMKLFVVIMMVIFFVFGLIFIFIIIEKYLLLEFLFEVCLVFGIIGLLFGIIVDLSNVGKCVIMIVMFIG